MGREAWREVRAVAAAVAVAEWYVCAPAPPSSFPEHVHAEFQLYANLDVPYDYRVGRRVQTVPPGQLSLVPPGIVHGGGDPGPRDATARFGVVYLPEERFETLVPEAARPLRSRGAWSEPDTDLVDLFWCLHARLLRPECARMRQDEAMADLLARLPRNSGEAVLSRAREPRAVRRARRFLHAHPERWVSLEGVAAEAGLAPYYLSRIFARGTGLAPAAYAAHLRLGSVRRRIAAGERVADVAADLGFADASHLTRVFREAVGTTPGDYRAR